MRLIATLRALTASPVLAVAALLPAVSGALSAQIPLAEYAERRAALAERLGDGVFLARGAVEPVLDYTAFYQSPAFRYLTGYVEPGASLLMTKRGSDVRWTLFVAEKDPAQEVWAGARLGALKARELTGLATRERRALDPALDSALRATPTLHFLATLVETGDTLNGDDRYLDALRKRHPSLRVEGANGAVMALRGKKSAAELELIRKAVAVSMDAHREAMRAVEPGMNEFELQALVEYTFRRNGAERPAYASIVGSGENATTLHYSRDDRFVRDGDVVVMDVGALYQGYAADITRSFPVNGRWTTEQRAIYQLVRDAQAAAERNARPWARFQVASDSARAVIAAGLARLGLIESPTATYDCGTAERPRQCRQVQLFYMHGLGHGIGLEVHDPDQSDAGGVIAPGSAFTLEPGVYVRANLLDILPTTSRNAQLAERIGAAVRRYANIGVRIEDDYVVTEEGVEWVSCGLPREADEVEALMQGSYAGPPARDSAKVDWYKADASRPAAAYQRPSSCVRM